MARQRNNEIRQEILKSAYDRFMKLDYNDVYLKDVAGDCNISVSLLHHYFPTKNDIVIHLIYDLLMKVKGFLEEQSGISEKECSDYTMVYYEVLVRFFVDVLSRDNGKMFRAYTCVLSDAKVMNKVVEFCIEHLSQGAARVDTYEKRYELHLIFGSLSQIVLMYLDNRLMYGLPDIVENLFDRTYFSLGMTKEERSKAISLIDKFVNKDRKEKFYHMYINSLQYFASCDW